MRLLPLALNVLHDLVIRGDLLFLISKHSIDSINRCIRHKLLEIRVENKLPNIWMKHNIVCHAQSSLVVLIVLSLAHSVGELPCRSLFTIWLDLGFLHRLINRVMEADIDEGLLVEEGLLEIVHELLSSRLDTESSCRLDQCCTWG